MIETDELLCTDPNCLTSRLLLQIHDELVFEVDDDHLDYVIKKLSYIIEHVITLAVEIPVKAYV